VYDAGDRLRQIVDSVAGTITRDYDLLDRLTLEITPEGSISYTYFVDGRRETMAVAGQPTVTYGYDDAHRLTSITQGESIVSLTYNNANRRSTLTLPNGIVATFGYDDAAQLTTLTYSLGPETLGTLTYAYDAVGNRTTVGGTWARTGLPQALSDATYDAANRIATWAGQSFSYDENGNLASDGLTSFNWNARNQLVGLSGATSASFEYDGFGRRRAKSVSGVSTGFLYDGLNTVQELTLGSPSANILPGFAVDEWLLRSDAAGTRHFLYGSLGSTVALADDLGTVQTEYTFEPFGKTTESGSSSSNVFAFTGREDDGTGLLFYRARYYDPSRQRFLSEDPIGFGGGDVNLYSYTFNSPTNFTDPTGEIVPVVLVPIITQCLKGAGTDIGISLLERLLSGRKSPSIEDLLKTGLNGCLSDVLNPFDRLGDLARMAKKADNLGPAARKALDAIKEWLGPGARTVRNKNGDLVAISQDGARRVRFDINHPYPHQSPHSHVEWLENGQWVKPGQIYPPDVPPR
jgi:RHS repeat-associated protein